MKSTLYFSKSSSLSSGLLYIILMSSSRSNVEKPWKYKYDDEGFLVNLQDITRSLVETANSYLQDLYTADLDYSAVEPFYSLQQISFTSYGTDVFSSISLLVDSLLIQMSPMSKQVEDAALCIYCNTIELTSAAKKELLETLRDRYKVNSVRALPEILERIELNIYSE